MLLLNKCVPRLGSYISQQNKLIDYYKTSKDRCDAMASGVLCALPEASVTNDFHVTGHYSLTVYYNRNEGII